MTKNAWLLGDSGGVLADSSSALSIFVAVNNGALVSTQREVKATRLVCNV